MRLLCEKHGRIYVNHSFKSHLSIIAALHTFATNAEFELLEFPQGSTELSDTLITAATKLARDKQGKINCPGGHGLGCEVDIAVARKFLVPLTIDMGAAGGVLYSTEGLLD